MSKQADYTSLGANFSFLDLSIKEAAASLEPCTGESIANLDKFTLMFMILARFFTNIFTDLNS